MKNEFTYQFLNEFEIASGGEKVQATEVTIKAPSNKVLRQVSEIEQEFEKAQMAMLNSYKAVVGEKAFNDMIDGKRDDVKSTDSAFTRDSVVKNLFSGGADINACFFALKEIMSSGNTENPTCVVDGRVKFTKLMFDDMSPQDTKNILGEYIVNFIVASPQN